LQDSFVNVIFNWLAERRVYISYLHVLRTTFVKLRKIVFSVEKEAFQ